MRASKLKINEVYTDEYKYKPKGRIDVPSPEEEATYINIMGRNGSLTKKRGYKDISIPVPFTMFDVMDGFKPTYRKTKHHLYNAKTLSFDDDETVYYKVKSVNIETAENAIIQFGEFTVTFTLDPFQYEANNDPVIITESTTITNDGYDSLPIINAEISGNGRIYINDNEIVIKDTNGAITIDSEQQNAYRKGAPPQNMNNRMVGQFPVLKSGNNTISFNDDVTSLEIILNKRWR